MNTFKIILAVVLPFGAFSSQAQQSEYFFQSKKLKQITTVDDCYQSYNIEMAQIVGGQFWKPYKDMTSLPSSTGGLTYNVSEKNTEMYSPLPPVNLADKRLITLAKGLAPAYVRVSGTWANSIYFQDDDKPKLDKAPNGFANVLTRSQWKGVLDFLKTTNSKLVTSFAVSNGVRDNNGVWTPIEAQKILNFTNKMGGTITAAELFNEPNIPTSGGDINNDYNDENFAKDQTVYRNWVKENTPTMKTVGPGTATVGLFTGKLNVPGMNLLNPEDMLAAKPNPVFDVFSYHFYGAMSMRMMQSGPISIQSKDALSAEWLSRTDTICKYYASLRDKFCPDQPIWLTETGEAAAGGDPFSATYLDCFRYLYQLGSLAQNGVKSVMHNTLCASEYSFIDQATLQPKPNYWAAHLWAKLMGTKVYDAGKAENGVYVFAHNWKGTKNGITLLVINTNTKPTAINTTEKSEQYTLTSKELLGTTVKLNGEELKLTTEGKLPTIKGKAVKAGSITVPATSVSFFTFR